MKRALAAFAIACFSTGARANGLTYCVGGFEFNQLLPTRDECQAMVDPDRWHFHTFLLGPDGKCHACWDEKDNTCISGFVATNPGYTVAPFFECVRAGAAPPKGEAILVEKGTPVSAPPPPPAPPPPVDVKAEVARLSPGPYAARDKVKVDVRVTGSDGKPRKPQGGEVVLVGGDGRELARAPVRNDGDRGTAEIRIPDGASGNVTVRYDPKGTIPLAPNERLGSVQSVDSSLVVMPCRLRGRVVEPAAGEVVVEKTAIALRGEVRDVRDAPAGAGALHGARAVFVADLADGRSVRAEAKVAADGSATATLTLPSPTGEVETVAVRLLGEGGSGDFCPGDAGTLQLTKLGIGVEIASPLDGATCYVDRPCRVAMRFRLPSSGPARASAVKFTRARDLAVAATLNSETLGALEPDGDGYALTFTPKTDGPQSIEIAATSGGNRVAEKRSFLVRQPLELHLPSEIDFGALVAGSGTVCRDLDFSRSRGVEEQPFRAEAPQPDEAPTKLALASDRGLLSLRDDKTSFTVPIERRVSFCLDGVPRCAAESPAPVTLTIAALGPDFPSERQTVRVTWRVVGRGFLACWWWLLALGGGALLFVFVAMGIVRPYRFTVDDAVKIAVEQKALARAVARRLRELPGGRAGFYRSAATGLRDDGSATAKLRAATVVLAARGGEVVIRSRGGLRRFHPQTRKFEEVPREKGGHVAAKNAIYSAGSLFFTLS